MSTKMTFNYFYGGEADQYSFYRIPKLLFTHEYFKNLSSDAKILYGLMLDRMSLSIKNQWFDEKNRAYIYFSVEDIMELLNCGKNKAVKSLQELDDENGIGLIEKNAKHADAQQESRVMMLSDEARGDANPILLIEEFEVTAGHAASAGQLDEQQLYYLMSRGLPRQEAEYLVVRGFLGSVIQEMPSQLVRDQMVAIIDRKLASLM